MITDIKMPKKDGLEVIEELRRKRPSVGIIAITGFGEGVLDKALELGADWGVQKPFRLQEMLEGIRRLLRG